MKKENEENIGQTLYSSLNVGSFLERKKRERTLEEKEEINAPKKEAINQEIPVVDKALIIKSLEKTSTKENPKEVFEETQRLEIPAIGKISEPLQKEEKSLEKITNQDLKLEENLEITKEGETQKLEIPVIKKMSESSVSKENVIKPLEKIPAENLDPAIKEKTIEPKNKIETERSSVKTENHEEVFLDKLVEDFEEKKPKTVESKKEKKKAKKSKGLIIGVVVCMIMDLFAFTGLFLTYGPISYFRNMLVTSAMTTQSHKYLARTFYSDQMIEKVLAGNVVKETGENTDASEINFDNSKDTGEYESVYEEQILKREKDALYKVIDIKGKGYVGYLVAIYDASRVKLISATDKGYGGALLTTLSKKYDAKVAMNASGFSNETASGRGSVPVGSVIQDGKIVSVGGVSGYGGGLAGFNKDHVLVLTRESPYTAIQNGMVDAVEFGPFLIVNGNPSKIEGNGGWGIAPRSVLAQRKDGIVLFLVIDGRNAKHSLGADMNELIKILTRYNAYNAVNLDGGGSSTLVVEGKLTNIPCGSTCGERYVPNAWIVR